MTLLGRARPGPKRRRLRWQPPSRSQARSAGVERRNERSKRDFVFSAVDAWATPVFALIVAAASIWWLWLMRGTTFFYDEWNFVLGYKQPLSQAIVAPHNGQFVAVPVLLYRGMFWAFGTSHYLPYRIMGIVFELAMVCVFYAYMRRRTGAAYALSAAILLLGCGQAFQDILWPFEVTFTVSLATGVGALMLLDGDGRVRRGIAAGLLVLSTASSGFGLVFLVGIAVEGVWSDGWRRKSGENRRSGVRTSDIWVVAPALAVYLVWYFTEHVGDAALSHAGGVPAYILQSAGYGISGLVGAHSLMPGEVLAVLLAIVFLVRVVLSPRTAGRLALAVSAAVSFWVLAALARGTGEPGASRYLQPDGLLLLLAVGELVRGWKTTASVAAAVLMRSGRRPRLPRRMGTVLSPLLLAVPVLLVAAVASNSVTLVDGSRGLRSDSSLVKADLAAVEMVGPALPANFQPAPTVAPQVTVGPYLDESRALGRQSDTPAQLTAAPEADRESADADLLAAMRPVLRPVAGGAGDPASVQWQTACGGGGLVRAEDMVTLRVGRHGVLVGVASGSAEIAMRLLASKFSSQVQLETGGRTARMTWARYVPTQFGEWTAEISSPRGGQVVACRLGAKNE